MYHFKKLKALKVVTQELYKFNHKLHGLNSYFGTILVISFHQHHLPSLIYYKDNVSNSTSLESSRCTHLLAQYV